jgi:hypothetical protein
MSTNYEVQYLITKRDKMQLFSFRGISVTGFILNVSRLLVPNFRSYIRLYKLSVFYVLTLCGILGRYKHLGENIQWGMLEGT